MPLREILGHACQSIQAVPRRPAPASGSPPQSTCRKALLSGFDAFADLGEVTVFQWAAKIRYGLIFKELSLLHDRRDPLAGRITTPELLEEYRQLHYFLQ